MGAIEYYYGNLGEVLKTVRTLIVPNQAVATYVTQWKYDSHNRLLEMIYPDEEKVTYGYNLGGQVEKVSGYKTTHYDYVSKIGYDKFEQRTYLKYCNGAETFYSYDPQRRRLQNLAVNAGGKTIMDNAYGYDVMSNVLSVVNKAAIPEKGKAGGQMSHSYTYDPLYRLSTASGTYKGADNKTASYTLAMGYDNMHRITSKRQHLTQRNVQFNGTLNAGYDLTYTYNSDEGKKFQLANVRDINYRTEETPTDSMDINNGHKYTYDANGNLVYINTSRVKHDGKEDDRASEQKYKWDEENRLLAADENGFVSNYWYDADGERTVKTSGENEAIYVNSEFSGDNTGTARFSLYVSPYLVAGQGGKYTKHIYIGSQRIVSKLGDLASYGADPRRIPYAGNEVDGLTINYKDKYAQQLQSIKDNYKTFDLPYNGVDNTDYVNGKGFSSDDDTPEAAQARAMVKTRAGEAGTNERMQFYYHPDHLGSSSYITNLDGEVAQHIEYVPFGEVFIEERNNTWNTPYLFNAKELDEETGMYYYGARYYEPRLSLWMSTDPAQEKYSNISTYCYVSNNPIKYIDIVGLEIGSPWRHIAPVIPKNKFIGWGNSPFYQNFINKNGRKPQCADYAREQLRVVGVLVGGGSDPTNMYVYSEKKGANKVVLDKAIKYIKSELKSGRPVFIGVDDAPNQKINEGTTDHFLVIVGMGNDKNGNYFQVYDNASGDVQDGTNSSNKLYHDEKKNIVEGKTNTSYSQGVNPYKLSQVRKNKVKVQPKPKPKRK